MTEYQLMLWNKLPVDKWIERNDELEKKVIQFQRSLSWLYGKGFIDIKMGIDINKELKPKVFYVRRKTTEEIKNQLNK